MKVLFSIRKYQILVANIARLILGVCLVLYSIHQYNEVQNSQILTYSIRSFSMLLIFLLSGVVCILYALFGKSIKSIVLNKKNSKIVLCFHSFLRGEKVIIISLEELTISAKKNYNRDRFPSPLNVVFYKKNKEIFTLSSHSIWLNKRKIKYVANNLLEFQRM